MPNVCLKCELKSKMNGFPGYDDMVADPGAINHVNC